MAHMVLCDFVACYCDGGERETGNRLPNRLLFVCFLLPFDGFGRRDVLRVRGQRDTGRYIDIACDLRHVVCDIRICLIDVRGTPGTVEITRPKKSWSIAHPNGEDRDLPAGRRPCGVNEEERSPEERNDWIDILVSVEGCQSGVSDGQARSGTRWGLFFFLPRRSK